MEEEIAEVKASLESAQGELGEKKEALGTTKVRTNVLHEDNAKLKHTLQKNEQRILELETELERHKKDPEKEQLRAELSVSDEKLQELSQEVSALRRSPPHLEELHKKKREIQKMQTNVTRLEKQAEQAAEALARERERYKRAEELLERAKARIDSLREKSQRGGDADLDGLREEVRGLNRKLRERNLAIVRINAEKELLANSVRHLGGETALREISLAARGNCGRARFGGTAFRTTDPI